MSIYSELDYVISDYVGYHEREGKYGEMELVCADQALHDIITHECTLHLRDGVPLDKLSDDAVYCIEEWSDYIRDYPSSTNTLEAHAEY